jgi:sortase A
VISIPSLELDLPLYLGASDENLSKGAAVLSQTSIPIGGNNTNCVVAGHRGWYGASYFRYLNKLQSGDEVIITNLWESLRYTVVEITTIKPNDVEAIHIRENRDLLTLLTCHPPASGGKERLLVFCERT